MREILQLKHAGADSAAEEKYGELERHSVEIIHLLGEIERKAMVFGD